MKVITLYELLGLIKDKKAPKYIAFDTERYSLNHNYHYVKNCGDNIKRLDIEYNLVGCLDEEVEVIEEEKEIEEIDICTGGIMGFDGVENITGALKDKINELVREVRKLKDK